MAAPEGTEVVFCSTCNKQVMAVLTAQHQQTTQPPDYEDLNVEGTTWSLLECPGCEQVFLTKEDFLDVEGNYATQDRSILYPSVPSLPTYEFVPRSIANRARSARNVFCVGEYEATVMYVRKALEALSSEHGVSGNLFHKIDELHKTGVLDDRLKAWAHDLRQLGNEGVHQIEKSPTKEDAADSIEFLDAIILYVYTLARKYSNFQERRASS